MARDRKTPIAAWTPGDRIEEIGRFVSKFFASSCNIFSLSME